MKAISIDQWWHTSFFTKKDDQSVYPLKSYQCKLSLIIFFYSCCCFIISLINTQRFGAFSCYLQYAGGGRNRGGSLIPWLCIPSLRFAFCFHIDLFLRGFFAHFSPYGPSLVAFLALSMHSALSSSSLQPSCPLPHHPGYKRQPSGLYTSHFINHSHLFFPGSSQGHFSSSLLPD